MSTHDIESANLEAHVSLCAERYKALELRFDQVERKITNLEILIHEIHDRIDTMSEQNSQQFQSWQYALIGALGSAVFFLVQQLIG